MKNVLKQLNKMFLIVLCACFFVVAGCEKEPELHTAHICEITGAQSTNYAIRVTLDDDDRVNDKYVDLQIKADNDEQILTIWEELEDPITVCLPKKDFWYNLTYLVSKSNGVGVEAGYKKYEDFGTKVFNLTSQNDTNLEFRVVVGQTKKNESNGEEILTMSEEISKEVSLKMKKHEEK